MKVVFLHHSTGNVIWGGGMKKWFKKYNKTNGTDYKVAEREFPAKSPYGWNNYPYDYWNIWVENAGEDEYQREPTLELLTPEYDMVVFKHCYPTTRSGEVIAECTVSQCHVTHTHRRYPASSALSRVSAECAIEYSRTAKT